jgi:hypothetical protein
MKSFTRASYFALTIVLMIAIPAFGQTEPVVRHESAGSADTKHANIDATRENKQLPQIHLWYGDRQRFGHLGNPQPLINVLGSIKSVGQVADAYFQLNEGRHQQMVFGGDLHRLARDGDFNIEIERSALKVGENTVRITARTPLGRDVTRELIIRYVGKFGCKPPIEVDFSKVENIQHVAEVIDGKWSLTEQGVRTAEPYYDRQLAFGDHSWKNVELRAEIIFHRHFVEFEGRNPHGPPYLSHAHTSFCLRWAGHPEDGFLPRRDWMNLGSLVALRCDLATPDQGSYWWMHFGRGIKGKPAKRSILAKEERFQIVPGERYRYRMRAETLSSEETRYSTKLWCAGDEEPDDWQLQAVDRSESVPSGSIVFVVHHSDVTLCRLRIESLKSIEASAAR